MVLQQRLCFKDFFGSLFSSVQPSSAACITIVEMPENKYSLDEQRQLIERAKHTSAAFGGVFDMYYPAILAYITRRTGDIALAEDMTSDVFIKALHGLANFTWKGVPISAWLYKIATNELRMYYRKKKYTSSLDELEERTDFEPLDERDFIEELIEEQAQLERHQTFLHVQACLAQLPLKYQEVLVLRFVEQKKVSEIAQIVDKREGTIKSLLSRGLRLLRHTVEKTAMQPPTPRGIIPNEGQINKP